MNEYIVCIELPSQLTDDFLALIPAQRERVNELLSSGILTTYSLSLDRSRVWTTVTAESMEKVCETIDSFPLRSYMQVSIHPLAFHRAGTRAIHQLSLN